MSDRIRYVHTNLVARNWKGLVEFYVAAFGCKIKPPERNIKGDWIDSLTTIRRAHIQGTHLYLPGYGKDGPTLEVFQYSPSVRSKLSKVNIPGFAHIAFSVTDVERILSKVEKHGGSRVGQVVSAVIEGVGALNVVYARDPEGNIIEIQKWNGSPKKMKGKKGNRKR
jgi:predicted enzyme related to lactoylglutathione lyase